jgi:hypothetical protein
MTYENGTECCETSAHTNRKPEITRKNMAVVDMFITYKITNIVRTNKIFLTALLSKIVAVYVG